MWLQMTLAERRLMHKLFGGMALYVVMFLPWRYSPDALFQTDEE